MTFAPSRRSTRVVADSATPARAPRLAPSAVEARDAPRPAAPAQLEVDRTASPVAVADQRARADDAALRAVDFERADPARAGAAPVRGGRGGRRDQIADDRAVGGFGEVRPPQARRCERLVAEQRAQEPAATARAARRAGASARRSWPCGSVRVSRIGGGRAWPRRRIARLRSSRAPGRAAPPAPVVLRRASAPR